ncbi:hypothetical protein DPMN_042112 [Dreissena polymorpha]|uniref:Uncharacterized protein n=1 Tax=Dreissena polymorpha TaxID=45954 RepID=A0A9D4D0F7_DREPO|nr:hypothetical protein DPMN_042112 [Dreissena polymorpha]
MAKAFETASGKRVPYQIAGHREGDIASCYADASLAEKELGWGLKLDLAKMCGAGSPITRQVSDQTARIGDLFVKFTTSVAPYVCNSLNITSLMQDLRVR